ncbi:MAG: hypothetical protein AB1393_02445 [Candidatus Edwardsbacteria bacterium]
MIPNKTWVVGILFINFPSSSYAFSLLGLSGYGDPLRDFSARSLGMGETGIASENSGGQYLLTLLKIMYRRLL